jgi:uncharacterized membrane protein YeaQ/YmgE (transglycosylase-associated protein family)
MGIFSWLVIGVLSGWLANKLTGTDGRRGFLLSVGAGIVAAVSGGLLYSGFPRVWAIDLGHLSVGELLVSFLTAAVLLTVARLARITG